MRSADLSPGSVFANRFEIDRQAGSGGMGAVYRAVDRYTGDAVALKVLHADTDRDVGSVDSDGERFGREAQLLSELRHPGIVAHVAHGQTASGQRFLAMEWLEGEDLHQRLARGPLSARDCVRLLRPIAEALSIAHDRGVIHRDIKPSNLFLCDGDVARPKVVDFGIARRVGASRRVTRTGLVVGTPEYMAPEQARGGRDLTPAIDLFAIGCVAYECLVGRSPFAADHVAAVLAKILFEEPALVSDLRPGVSPELSALVGRLLAKEPSARVSNAVDLRSALLALGDLADVANAATIAISPPDTRSFAAQEQNLFSIVLAAPPSDSATDATQLGDGSRDTRDQRSLFEAVAALGGTPDRLIDGTLVITVPPQGSALDQAALAARAALLVKERWPEATVSMATGKGTALGRTAVGEVVELAARGLRARAPRNAWTTPHGVWVDHLSAKLLQGRFVQASHPDGVAVIAEERDVDASRLLLGKPTPCVGREAELGSLELQLGSCIEESSARAVLITASPGVGKSRLRHEFLRRIERRGESITVLSARGDLMSAGTAYQMLGRALRGLAGVESGQSPDDQRHRLETRLSRHLAPEDRARVLPFLGVPCDVAFSDDEYPALKDAKQTPKFLPDRVKQACVSFLAAECRAAPVVVILDDLHWGDELTLSLFDQALRELRDSPFMVIGLARPELYASFAPIWVGHNPHKIELKGLGKRACERLIQQALGRSIGPNTVEWMIEQSGGNALFLEELIRAAAEGQVDKRPDTLIAMLQARIGHLPTGPRLALLAASVFGQSFWQGGVAKIVVSRADATELREHLNVLVAKELIEAHDGARIAGQAEFAFRHALVRDAAYGLLTDADRRLGHELAADFLEESDDNRAVQAILGHHRREAGAPERALTHFVAAGDHAAKLCTSAEARQHYAAAVALIEPMPKSLALARLQSDLLSKQVYCSLYDEAPAVNFQRLARAREILEGLRSDGHGLPDDPVRLARLDLLLGRQHVYSAQTALAMACFQRVLPVGREFQEPELIMVPSVFLGWGLLGIGEIRRGIAMLEPVAASMERLFGKDIDTLRAHLYLAILFAIAGRHRTALGLIDHVRPWTEETQQPVYRGTYFLLVAAALYQAGEHRAVFEFAERAIRIGSEHKEALIEYFATDMKAVAQSGVGDHAAALESRERAIEIRRRYDGGVGKDMFEAAHCDLYVRAERFAEAANLAERVATAARAAGSKYAQVHAERSWARALSKLGAPADDVDSHLSASLQIADESGNLMGALWAEVTWGQICHERGDVAAMRDHFEQVRRRMTDEMTANAREEFLKIMRTGD